MFSENNKNADKFERLRCEAIELLERNPDFVTASGATLRELLHELNVHQTELIIQNEELKASQEELAKITREYEALYEWAPCGYITLTPKGTISRINQTALRLLEEQRIQPGVSRFCQFIEPGWKDLYYAALENSGRTGRKQSLDLTLIPPLDKEIWIRAEIEAERNDDYQVRQWKLVFIDISHKIVAENAQGKFKQTHCMLSDITDQKKLERTAQQLEPKLQQNNKLEAIGVLAGGGIAHEFKTILQPIIGFSELTLNDLPDNSPLRENLEEILKGSQRAAEFVRQILDSTSQKQKVLEPLMVQGVLKEAIKFLRASISSNIEFYQEISPAPIYILNDPIKLHEIAINLCTNACHAMEDKGGLLSIVVTEVDKKMGQNFSVGEKVGRYCKISIIDSGGGILPEHRSKIFDPYFSTKEVGKGSGLGLSVVHGIVKEWHGQIEVKSRPGKTQFDVYLPIINIKGPMAVNDRKKPYPKNPIF